MKIRGKPWSAWPVADLNQKSRMFLVHQCPLDVVIFLPVEENECITKFCELSK
jgi:hypothetical protein